MNITPKSPEELLMDFFNRDIRAQRPTTKEHYDWLRHALASHLAWAADEADKKANHYDCEECSCPCLNKYHYTLLSLAERLTKE